VFLQINLYLYLADDVLFTSIYMLSQILRSNILIEGLVDDDSPVRMQDIA